MNDHSSPLDRFERQTAVPMLVLAVLIIPLLAIPLLVDLSSGTERLFVVFEWFIWAAFAAEYLIRLYLAPQKGTFFKRNLPDLLIVALPFLRPLRVVRSARALRLLRAGRLLVYLSRATRSTRIVLTRHKLHYLLAVTLLVIFSAALLVGSIEAGAPESNIEDMGEALWWAVTTVTTVGYGDAYPVTPVGRGIAVVLMILGIGLFGLLAASLASVFIEEHQDQESHKVQAEVLERLERIEQALGPSNSAPPQGHRKL